MTSSALESLIVKALMRSHGGTLRQWRMVVGPVELLDQATHPHCNWRVRPSGNSQDIARVERLLDTLRLEYPIVIAG
jgi:hypothetical protein